MSDRDEVLGLLDDLARIIERSQASSIEVETDAFAVKVTRASAVQAEAAPRPKVEREAVAKPEPVQRVRATTVGIFSATREWQAGDEVKRGTVLGAIQSLGHMADITAPADGKIEEILVAAGAPVEYGQALFAISLR